MKSFMQRRLVDAAFIIVVSAVLGFALVSVFNLSIDPHVHYFLTEVR